ncbi:MAG: hypothetical protein AB7N65_21605 [Vicinamibacterales bacterium]
MSVTLLARLAELGVNVERAGSQLLLDGPEDALTESLVAEVAAAKPTLLSMLDVEDRMAVADAGAQQDQIDADGSPDDALRPAPWRCRCCGSGERRQRAEWGDWVCAFCRAIVAGPDQTERPWRVRRRDVLFPGTGSPAVTWGRERGYLAVRDPHSGDWHEIPYQEAPPVWQAAVRRGRGPSVPGSRGRSE